MRQVVGLFAAALAGGPLLCFAMIAVASWRLKLDSTDVVPWWFWATAGAVFMVGLALALWPNREGDTNGNEPV